MTVISDTLTDIGLTGDRSGVIQFYAPGLRDSSDSDRIITTQWIYVPVAADGSFTTPDLDPGPARVRIDGCTYTFVLPDEPGLIRLWPLIEASVVFPPGPPDATIQAAVNDWLATHPPVGTPASATPTSQGIVQLAGDLAGTASAPTVPGLAGVSVTKFAGTFAAKLAAAAAAAGPGGHVFVPAAGGPYTLSSPVTLTDVGIISDGAVINVASLGTGIAAITVTGSGTGNPYRVPLSGFTLTGPGTYSLGTRTANTDGIKVTGDVYTYMTHLKASQFDSGIIWDNTLGHLWHTGITVTNCYYGIYCTANNYDYAITDSIINGNTFANFATPADQGFGSLVLTNVHCGFAPYGIYQEPTPAAQGANKMFLQEVSLINTRFESIGCGAIVSDATENASNHSITSDLRVQHCGFSWNPAYTIPARGNPYAWVLPCTMGVIEIVGTINPFSAGSSGVFHIKNGAHLAFTVIGANTLSDFTVDNGLNIATTACYNLPLPADHGLILAGDATNSALVLGTASGFVEPDGTPARRFGGDASGLYLDSPATTFRDSSNGYATIAQITGTGLSATKLSLTAGPSWTAGAGSPEGVVTAPVGAMYSRTNGIAGSVLYVKTSGTGNTGWSAIA